MSPARIVAAFLAQAAFSLNAFAKLSLLEGIAGKSPGTWTRRGRGSFREIQAEYGIDAKAFAGHGKDIYNIALGLLKPLVRNLGVTAEDVIQSAVAGLSPTEMKPGKPLFWAAGEFVRRGGRVTMDHVRADDVDWSHIINYIAKSLKNRLKDIYRHQMVEERDSGGKLVSEVREDTGEMKDFETFSDLRGEDQMDLVLRAISDVGNPAFQKLQDQVAKVIETTLNESQMKVFQTMLDIARTKRRAPKVKEVAEVLGVSVPAVSQSTKRIQQALAKSRILRDPKITEPIMSHYDVREIGYGLGFGRRAKRRIDIDQMVASYLARVA